MQWCGWSAGSAVWIITLQKRTLHDNSTVQLFATLRTVEIVHCWLELGSLPIWHLAVDGLEHTLMTKKKLRPKFNQLTIVEKCRWKQSAQ